MYDDGDDDDDIPFLDAVDYAVHFHSIHRPVNPSLRYDDGEPMIDMNGESLTMIYNGEPMTLYTSHKQCIVATNTESYDPANLQYTAFPTDTNPPTDTGTTATATHSPDTAPTNTATPRTVTTIEPNYETMRPLFGWLPTDVIKETFARTTQMARMPMSETLKNFFRSPYPAMNVHRRNEPVATDTFYSDTPAIDDGATSAQIFFGTKTTLTDVYGMKSDKQFVNTLEDNIRERGAMNSLLSDSAQTEISKKVKGILRGLFI